MQILKKSFSIVFSLVMLILLSTFFGCDNNSKTKYIDLDASLKSYQNYTYHSNLFLSDMFLEYASDENLNQINWFYKDMDWNNQFEEIIKQLKLYNESSVALKNDDKIERSSDEFVVKSKTGEIKLQAKEDYKTIKISIENSQDFILYEFVTLSEDSYSSQFVIKTDKKYLIYQITFDGLSGKIAVLHNQDSFYSIYADGIKDDFANKKSAAYYFD